MFQPIYKYIGGSKIHAEMLARIPPLSSIQDTFAMKYLDVRLKSILFRVIEKRTTPSTESDWIDGGAR